MWAWQRTAAALLALTGPCRAGKSGTATQTVAKGDDFAGMRPCAQGCFWDRCWDLVGAAAGCAPGCGTARNDCYCRADTMSIVNDYLLDCVKGRCNVGDYRIDATSATNVYNDYCHALEYTAAEAKPTTTTKAQTTAAAQSVPDSTLATRTSTLTQGSTPSRQPQPTSGPAPTDFT